MCLATLPSHWLQVSDGTRAGSAPCGVGGPRRRGADARPSSPRGERDRGNPRTTAAADLYSGYSIWGCRLRMLAQRTARADALRQWADAVEKDWDRLRQRGQRSRNALTHGGAVHPEPIEALSITWPEIPPTQSLFGCDAFLRRPTLPPSSFASPTARPSPRTLGSPDHSPKRWSFLGQSASGASVLRHGSRSGGCTFGAMAYGPSTRQCQ